MAILNSFPPSNTISPSVRFTEVDLTVLTTTPSPSSVGLVGFATKGPINTPTLVTNQSELQKIFGNANPDGDFAPYMIYCAQNTLTQGNNLFIVRVADTDPISEFYAETASVEVPSAGGILQVVGATFDQDDTISYTSDKFFRWSLNGIVSGKILILLADANRPGVYANQPYTVAQIVDALNAQLDTTIDGVEFYLDTNGTNVALGFQSVWAYGSQSRFEIISVTNSLVTGPVTVTGSSPTFVNVNNALGLGTAMTMPSKIGISSYYPVDASHSTAGVWDFATGTYTLQVAISGTGNVNIDNVIRTYDFTSVVTGGGNPFATTQDLVDALNASLGTIAPTVGTTISPTTDQVGWQFDVDSTNYVTVETNTDLLPSSVQAGALYGRYAQINVRGGTLATIFGLSNVGASGTTDPGVADGDPAQAVNGRWIGDDTLVPTDTGYYTFEVTADTPGTEGNQTFVTFKNYPEGDTFTMDVFVVSQVSGSISNVESWGNLTKNAASYYYVQTYINQNSSYVRIIDNTATSAPPASSILESTIAVNRLRLAGGSDGYPYGSSNAALLRDELLIGNPISLSGLYSFSDPEQTNISLCAVPGASSTAVILELIRMCELYRQDCMAIIDPPAGLTPTNIVQWQNGQSDLNVVRFDSDFAALYWPWIYYYDTFNQELMLVPPSVGVVPAYVRNDAIAGPWNAPAGNLRGIVPNCVNVQARPTLQEKDNMYGNNNAVNPIVQYVGEANFLIWGQKTLQRIPSALDRVNVRRMLNYVEQQVRTAARSLLFQPHTEQLRQQFVIIASSILDNVKAQSGITEFIVVCNEALNPPDVIDRNEMRAQIGIVPTRTVEFIFIEFTLYRTGQLPEVTA